MSEADVWKGCSEYVCECAKCGFEDVVHWRNKIDAIADLRKSGWSIGEKNICRYCKEVKDD